MLWLVLALDLAGIRPGSLRESAVLVARRGELAAVVDREAGLWVGEGRLTRVASLGSVPDGIALGEGVIGTWSVERTGLLTETSMELYDLKGASLEHRGLEGPAVQALGLEGEVAFAFPGMVELLADDRPREVIIPLVSVERLSVSDRTLLVHGDGGRAVSVDLDRGCAEAHFPPESALDRWLLARTTAWCQPSTGRAIGSPEEQAARDAAIRGAVAAGSPALLAGLGVVTRHQIAALAPGPEEGKARFTQLSGEKLSAKSGTFGPEGAVILQDRAAELSGWAEGDYAPACYARVLLVSSTPELAARAEELVRARARDDCAGELRALPSGVLLDSVAGSTVRYTSSGGDLLARRVGPYGPAQVRLDIASLTPKGDGLLELGQLPNLYQEWIVPAAKATELVLDVDGSAVCAAGWEVLRVDPTGKRVARVPLLGPVEALALRKNGSVDLVTGGQQAVVDLDRPTVHHYDPAPGAKASTPARERGPWSVEGGALWLQESGGRKVKIPLALPALDVAAAGSGAVVETPLGLVGLDGDAEPIWRMADTGAWAVTKGMLVVGTAGGVAGYRLPR